MSWRVLLHGRDTGIIETNWPWASRYWAGRPGCTLLRHT